MNAHMLATQIARATDRNVAGADVSTFEDEGIEGTGVVVRYITDDGRYLEMTAEVRDVTDDLIPPDKAQQVREEKA